MISEEEQEQAKKKLGMVTKMMGKLMPGIDFGEISEQVKGGIEEFKDFKIAIEVLAEKVEKLEERVEKLEEV